MGDEFLIFLFLSLSFFVSLSSSSLSFSSSSSSSGPPPMAEAMFHDSSYFDSDVGTITTVVNSSNNIVFLPFQDNFVIFIAVVAVMLLLFLIFVIVVFKFKLWRRFLPLFSSSSPSSTSRTRTVKHIDDLERPLVSEDLILNHSLSGRLGRNISSGESGQPLPDDFSLTLGQGPAPDQPVPSASAQLLRSDSFVLNISDTSEDGSFGKTLLRPNLCTQTIEVKDNGKKEELKYTPTFDGDSNIFGDLDQEGTVDQRSILVLEVISGPSRGLHYSIKSTDSSRLPLKIGRVAPSDLLVKDSEVSGKHALINWNHDKLRWELMDMGSLNGTLLNFQAINHPDSESRNSGDPVDIASGDIITLGSNSQILVKMSSPIERHIPFGVGVASDPMALRRGGKRLPMEDVCFYHWPLPGTEQFGMFAICDGHGNASAAISASKIMPEVFSGILSDSSRKDEILVQGEASNVFREAFSQTEASMAHHDYQGCTATVLLVWADGNRNFLAQCANVGDSSCYINIDGKLIKMTEDHRLSSSSERLRVQAIGEPLKDGETRLLGINLARMLGDQFLKQQDGRFSSEPFVSEVVHIGQDSRGFALLASDGFWDVVNVRKASQLIQQTRDKNPADPEKVAKILLNEARKQRTQDNTTILFLDFDNFNRNVSCKF